MVRITSAEVHDIRFPTSVALDGSDAMNVDADYSAAYVVLRTSSELSGYGMTFTIGRGNELCVLAARDIAARIVGWEIGDLLDDVGVIYKHAKADHQLRWLGPEKGVVHLALSAVMNAVWDLLARQAGKPLWALLASMSAEQLVAASDFTYLTDVLTPAEALQMLRATEPTRAARIAELERRGYPCYTTSPGWLGYDDAKLARLTREAVAEGFNHIKLKVGARLEDDIRRAAIVRQIIGPERHLLIDANQVWDVNQAIDWVHALQEFNPLWIEEPTSPDDYVGHAAIRRAVAPIGVATGEHAHNRLAFKQLLQLEAIDYCQIDACRLASINEIVPILLLAAKFGVPVCPHAGGVGLCELVQHISIFDFVAVSASQEGRITEYVEHLHEHFVDPVVVKNAAYQLPTAPGYSTEMKGQSILEYTFPTGQYWRDDLSLEVVQA